MTFKRLFLFVEGDDDERFFRAVLLPLLSRGYEEIRFVQFSRLKREKVRAWMRSVAGMKADYIYIRDLDRHPCATAARDRVGDSLPWIDPERVQIVKAEIESWYCAGIHKDHPWGTLDVARVPDTHAVTKEAFEVAISRKGEPKIPAMLAILEGFDLDTALRRNESLRRFVRKFITGVLPA
jgi:hypothetical protein